MIDLSWLLQRLFQAHGALPRLLWRNGRAFRPIHMLMEVTYRCNLRCTFCQYLDIIEGRAKPFGPSPRDLPFESLRARIDELGRGRLISFCGGETLARKDFPEILRHAARRHRVHIITNGALIDEDVARLYTGLAPRRVWQNGLVLLEVSLEGDEATHDRVVQRPGSWRRAVQGLEHLVRLRREAGTTYPKLGLKLVVTADTLPAMTDVLELGRRLGVDVVNYLAEHDLVANAEGGNLDLLTRPQRRPSGVDPAAVRRALVACYERAEAEGMQIRLTPHVPIDEFVRHYRDDRSLDPSEYACEGPWSRLAVGADGRYAPMCHYAATGDMRAQTIAEVWNGEHFRRFRREAQAARVFPGCSGCCNLTYVGDLPYGLAGVARDAPASEPAPVRIAAG